MLDGNSQYFFVENRVFKSEKMADKQAENNPITQFVGVLEQFMVRQLAVPELVLNRVVLQLVNLDLWLSTR